MSKPQGKCVFCGGSGMSKEHIWSDWLSDLIKPPQSAHQQYLLHTRLIGEDIVMMQPDLKYKPRQGSLLQRKIRKVCAKCNGGWMSMAVNEAKPFAELLVRGMSVKLDGGAQKKLATWVIVTSMMAEFTDLETASIKSDEFSQIRQLRGPLPNWTIGIALYQGEQWAPTRYRHYAPDVLMPDRGLIEQAAVQFTTFTLGNLAIHAVSSRHIGIVDEVRRHFFKKSLCQIWPLIDESLVSEKIPQISDSELLEISSVVGRLDD